MRTEILRNLRDGRATLVEDANSEHQESCVTPLGDDVSEQLYGELRAIARRYMAVQPQNHTLQATALLHEAYIRMAERGVAVNDRGHLLAVASTIIRQVLVDHARSKGAAKRNGGRSQLTLDEAIVPDAHRTPDLEALDEALGRLAAFAPRQASIIEMRFFGGLSVNEVATALSIAPRTVEADWTAARSWLRRELEGSR